MNADIKGCLNNLNKAYKVFEHNGKRMTKEQVRKILVYGLQKGYDHTGQFSDDEIENILSSIK